MAVPLIGHDNSLEGVLQVLNKHDGVFEEQDERVATALAAQCAVALQRTRLLKDLVTKERMERELLVARRIQMGVMPQEMPRIEGYDVFGWCRPADQTGGDVFDLQPMKDGRLMILLADATGHGIGPALSVTQMRAMLCMCTRFDVSLIEASQQINDQLADDLSTNRNVAAIIGKLDPVRHRVDYLAAGQGPLLHYHHADDRVEWLRATTPSLGILGDFPVGKKHTMHLDPGDVLLLATDGIFEYENSAEEQFGDERVAQVVRNHRDEPMAQLTERLVSDLENFVQGTAQADDMTVVLLKREPG